MTKTALSAKSLPGLGAFMAATRWQESGSPQGNYTEPNGGGAYQFTQGTWNSNAQAAGYPNYVGVSPSSVPPAIQDAVASYAMTSYYYGPANRSWPKVSMMWNGGEPYPVPNPGLGPGKTTADYAASVMSRMAQIQGGKIRGLTTSGLPAGSGSSSSSSSSSCLWKMNLPFGMSVCLDNVLWGGLALVGMGGFIVAGSLIAYSLGKRSGVTDAVVNVAKKSAVMGAVA